MSFYGRSNRILVEQTLQKGSIKDCQIAECDLSGMQIINVQWDHTDIRDLHANDISVRNSKLENSNFYRSSLMRAIFYDSALNAMVFDGLTLIKSQWEKSRVTNSTLKNLCLQRAAFSGSRFVSTSLLDFEALNARIENCIFAHCMVGINYGSGMNGFSSGEIKNCIFYHCLFEGYPLRGAKLEGSVFAWCSGQIGDDMESSNVAGLGLRGNSRNKTLGSLAEARRLTERYAS